jgi:hypothetical protein
MQKFGRYVLQHWGMGSWLITNSETGEQRELPNLDSLFEPLFRGESSASPSFSGRPDIPEQAFCHFFRTMYQKNPEDNLRDAEFCAVLSLNQSQPTYLDVHPSMTDQQHLTYLIAGWINGYNSFHKTQVKIDRVLPELLPDFLP